jgi:hypothetical protein
MLGDEDDQYVCVECGELNDGEHDDLCSACWDEYYLDGEKEDE